MQHPLEIAVEECRFCDWSSKIRDREKTVTRGQSIYVTPDRYRRHVCMHLEQAALNVIPRDETECEDGGSDNDSGGASSDGSLYSLDPRHTPVVSNADPLPPAEQVDWMELVDWNRPGFDKPKPESLGELGPAASTRPEAYLPIHQSDPSSKIRTRVKAKYHKCDAPGCEHLNFSRMVDLARHQETKHTDKPSKQFVCYAQGCFRKNEPWAFVRPDKLTSHIKATHSHNTIFTRCPSTDCVFGRATLEVLGVHIERVHVLDAATRSVLNASSCRMMRCRVWSCSKYMAVRNMLAHLESRHSVSEMWAATSDLNADCLFVHEFGGTTGFTVSVCCPACGTGCEMIEDFERHLWKAHLYLDQSGGSDHFLRWRDTLASRVIRKPFVKQMLPWTQLQRSHVVSLKMSTVLECPACRFSVANASGLDAGSEELDLVQNHHLSLLRAESDVVAELRPHRFQIMRLYPAFVTHPVFADYDNGG